MRTKLLIIFALFFAIVLQLVKSSPVPATDAQPSENDEDEKTFQRISDMITRVQKTLVTKTHDITAQAAKNKLPLSKQELGQIAQLRKRYDSLENFRRMLLAQKRRQQHSKKQYQECVRSLGKAICDQNTTFYLWAQMLAKDILSRPMDKPLELAEE